MRPVYRVTVVTKRLACSLRLRLSFFFLKIVCSICRVKIRFEPFGSHDIELNGRLNVLTMFYCRIQEGLVMRVQRNMTRTVTL